MAAYFTALADADAAAIARLQSAVAAKDLVISELQQQGAQQQGQQPQQPQPPPQHQQHARSNFSNSIFLLGNPAGNAPRGSGWAASRKCTLAVALAALALVVIIIGLAAGLGAQRARQPRAGAALAPPEFVRAPVLLSSINGSSSSSSSSLNIQVALTQPGTLHYAVVRAGAAWEGSAAAVAQAAAGLLGDTALEGAAVACGQLPIPLANVDFTLSIGNQTTSAECAQAAPVGADGRAARKSCARCPSLQPSAPYVVYLAPSRQTSVGALASVEASFYLLEVFVFCQKSMLCPPKTNQTFYMPIRAPPPPNSQGRGWQRCAPGHAHTGVNSHLAWGQRAGRRWPVRRCHACQRPRRGCGRRRLQPHVFLVCARHAAIRRRSCDAPGTRWPSIRGV
jgi:hypothetical protein